MDILGIGVSDLFIYNSSWALTLATTSYSPDLITSFTDGVGAAQSVTYQPIDNSSGYTKGSSSSYPSQDVTGPIYAVSQVSASNPGYSNYLTNYSYAGAIDDLHGRGFLGFSSMTATDPQTGIVTTTVYNTAWPWTGLVASVTKASGSNTLSYIYNAYGANPVNGYTENGKNLTGYFVYLTGSNTTANDLDGTALPGWVKTYTYDTYGNITKLVTAHANDAFAGDSYSETDTNTYTNDTTHWDLGLLTEAQVNKTFYGDNETRTTAYSYDPNTDLLMATTLEPESSSLWLETYQNRDHCGNILNQTVVGADPGGLPSRTYRQKIFSYDSYCRFVATEQDLLSSVGGTNTYGTSQYAYSPAFGLETSNTDYNGLVTTTAYDYFGRKTKQTNPDTTYTTWGYVTGTYGCGGNSYWINQASYGGNGTQISPGSSNYFDCLNRNIGTNTQAFDNPVTGGYIVADIGYDSFGNVNGIEKPYESGSPVWTLFAHDILGRVTSKTTPDSAVTTYGYHGLTTTVRDGLTNTTTTTLYPEGMVQLVTDAAGGTTNYGYGAFTDELWWVKDATTYAYDAANNVNYATILNGFDLRGRKVWTTDLDTGHWTYSYDAADELISQTDAKNQTTSFTYDTAGHMVNRTEPDLTSTWTYGTAAPAIGLMTEAQASGTVGVPNGYTRNYSYNSHSLVTAITSSFASGNFTTSFGYDADYRPSTVTTFRGWTRTRVYNSVGYLSGLVDPQSGQTYTVSAEDASLNPTSISYGSKVTGTRGYDVMERLTQSAGGTGGAGSGNLQNLNYTYDADNNLTTRNDLNRAWTETFGYDSLNRVKSATIPNNVFSQTQSYDATGNITNKSESDATASFSWNYQYPVVGSAQPHTPLGIWDAGGENETPNGAPLPTSYTAPTFSYDANGNLLNGAGRVLTWTSFNMPATVSESGKTIVFQYDDQHRRTIQYTAGGAYSPYTQYYWDDPDGYLQDYWPDSTDGREYTYLTLNGLMVGQDLQEWQYQSGNWVNNLNATFFTFLDNLGSISTLSDPNGDFWEADSYEPFGKQRKPTGVADPGNTLAGSSWVNRGFTGHEEMPSFGLINYNARLYDPQLGKFLSPDPEIQSPLDGQNFNRYAYVENRPLIANDPTGYYNSIDDAIRDYPEYSCTGDCGGGGRLWTGFLRGRFGQRRDGQRTHTGRVTNCYRGARHPDRPRPQRDGRNRDSDR